MRGKHTIMENLCENIEYNLSYMPKMLQNHRQAFECQKKVRQYGWEGLKLYDKFESSNNTEKGAPISNDIYHTF